MFDAMMGMYSYDVDDEKYTVLHTVFTMVHIYIANIFLLNYLVAILSTVYEKMMEMGDFAFKCNKYWYIERYLIAFKDQWGYTQLIVHAPPINILLISLLTSIFKQDAMLRAANLYSLANFWVENLFFIFYQLLYELMLVPIIYLRMFYNVVKLGGYRSSHLILFWVFCGPFFLLYGASIDIYYYVKILCDYKLDDDLQVKMEEEDQKQDKIVIYNEIISVLKSVLFIFQQK
mmetsp:Transcript_37727/g.57765  ORF Transcript_37727/g.57765 Transcript_37727/m.57765 type:complete len:232 (+) Transcript_37727:2680-3375(+)